MPTLVSSTGDRGGCAGRAGGVPGANCSAPSRDIKGSEVVGRKLISGPPEGGTYGGGGTALALRANGEYGSGIVGGSVADRPTEVFGDFGESIGLIGGVPAADVNTGVSKVVLSFTSGYIRPGTLSPAWGLRLSSAGDLRQSGELPPGGRGGLAGDTLPTTAGSAGTESLP